MSGDEFNDSDESDEPDDSDEFDESDEFDIFDIFADLAISDTGSRKVSSAVIRRLG